MATYVIRNGKLVLKAEQMAAEAPHVISDEMDSTWHPANGRRYTSKQKFREATKDAGCIEFGNENLTQARKPVTLDRRQRREDIRKALHDLRDGRAPTIRQILSGEER
jgi:hypothetical protein